MSILRIPEPLFLPAGVSISVTMPSYPWFRDPAFWLFIAVAAGIAGFFAWLI